MANVCASVYDREREIPKVLECIAGPQRAGTRLCCCVPQVVCLPLPTRLRQWLALVYALVLTEVLVHLHGSCVIRDSQNRNPWRAPEVGEASGDEYAAAVPRRKVFVNVQRWVVGVVEHQKPRLVTAL